MILELQRENFTKVMTASIRIGLEHGRSFCDFVLFLLYIVPYCIVIVHAGDGYSTKMLI